MHHVSSTDAETKMIAARQRLDEIEEKRHLKALEIAQPYQAMMSKPESSMERFQRLGGDFMVPALPRTQALTLPSTISPITEELLGGLIVVMKTAIQATRGDDGSNLKAEMETLASEAMQILGKLARDSQVEPAWRIIAAEAVLKAAR